MSYKHKFFGGLIIFQILFICAMIDTRGEEMMGTCIVGEYTFYPVSNLDCQGSFEEGEIWKK